MNHVFLYASPHTAVESPTCNAVLVDCQASGTTPIPTFSLESIVIAVASALSSIPVEVKLVCVPDTSAASKLVKALAFNAGRLPVNAVASIVVEVNNPASLMEIAG